MPEARVRVFHADDLERHQDEDGFIETLGAGSSGVAGISFSRFGTAKDGRVPPHHHTANTIAYLVRGRAVFLTGATLEQRHEMRAGDYIVVPSGVLHAEETVGGEPAEFILVRDAGGGETVYLDG